MKNFIRTAVYFSIFLFITLEVFFRISHLASDLQIRQLNVEDSIILNKPGTDGYFTRGTRGEVFSHFQINKQGWNSVVDYDSVTDKTIAIVGDSYIEGRYVNVEESLGRRIEKLYPGLIVHEYGNAGANFFDYNNICRKLIDRGYKRIYVNMGPKDLFEKSPSFTQKEKYRQDPLQQVYKHSALARYMVLNMQITAIVTGKREGENKKKVAGKGKASENMGPINEKFQYFAIHGVVYMYENPILDSLKTDHYMLKIIHEKLPEDYGFNGHWNENGYDNVANTIARDLKKVNF